jgi:hypothetical protein
MIQHWLCCMQQQVAVLTCTLIDQYGALCLLCGATADGLTKPADDALLEVRHTDTHGMQQQQQHAGCACNAAC